jgi:hypothetical protein
LATRAFACIGSWARPARAKGQKGKRAKGQAGASVAHLVKNQIEETQSRSPEFGIRILFPDFLPTLWVIDLVPSFIRSKTAPNKKTAARRGTAAVR